ncbi:MAG: bifunctional 4-hydroxy-2-oxoglutarate aldolase/2-dehydro-3-deoxy-phosphogluconate aldolase [Erysipelotrichaceae bacterium]|jgi:2-dehydro-3-deoxyphosphogluconate aldolase/(4S)-4-hydroxy-2-oxoglutarate aldolase
MSEILNKIKEIGIVPVVVIDDAKDAIPLANALIEGGLKCAEVTFRTASAKETIKLIVDNFPDMLVGAGTVLTTKQVDDAIEAGARFIVSPGLNPKIVKYCNEKGILIIPGISNASDIEIALENNLEVVKFFPAELLGGLRMIKALAAPYVNVKFMPTGGINTSNVKEYLEYDRIIACGGSWMVSSKLIRSGEFQEISRLAREASEIVKESRGVLR